MDDFLHNLRSGKLKRQRQPKRAHSGQQFKSTQRQPTFDRRRSGDGPYLLVNAFKEALGPFNETLKGITATQESIAKSAKRQANAIEKIADGFQRILNQGPDKNGTPITPESPSAVEDGQNHKLSESAKKIIFSLITTMRSDGAGWEKIARAIAAEGYPTVSGRGQWRGVMVKNLYDMMSES